VETDSSCRGMDDDYPGGIYSLRKYEIVYESIETYINKCFYLQSVSLLVFSPENMILSRISKKYRLFAAEKCGLQALL
jgi:hypothetical protein